MGKQQILKLIAAYEKAVESYAIAFCEKHGFDLKDADWVNNEPGTILCVADYFFDFREIKYDIDNDVPKEMMIRYYDYCLDLHHTGGKPVNYKNWLNGRAEN
jgi:hypothetical protein